MIVDGAFYSVSSLPWWSVSLLLGRLCTALLQLLPQVLVKMMSPATRISLQSDAKRLDSCSIADLNHIEVSRSKERTAYDQRIACHLKEFTNRGQRDFTADDFMRRLSSPHRTHNYMAPLLSAHDVIISQPKEKHRFLYRPKLKRHASKVWPQINTKMSQTRFKRRLLLRAFSFFLRSLATRFFFYYLFSFFSIMSDTMEIIANERKNFQPKCRCVLCVKLFRSVIIIGNR